MISYDFFSLLEDLEGLHSDSPFSFFRPTLSPPPARSENGGRYTTVTSWVYTLDNLWIWALRGSS